MIEASVYRMFDADGRLLYVGMTINVPQRLAKHARDKAWWPDVARIELKHFAGRYAAATEEWKVIDSESPLYNVMRGSGVSWDTAAEHEADRAVRRAAAMEARS